jgi:hypothetical protein
VIGSESGERTGREARVEKPSRLGDVGGKSRRRQHEEPEVGTVPGARERPLCGLERLVLLVAHRREDVVAVAIDVAESAGGATLPLIAAAAFGDAPEDAGLDAGEIRAQDDVDDAGHRIGSVDRRCAVLQDLDALDRGQRDLVDVDCANRLRRSSRRDAVEKDERRAVAHGRAGSRSRTAPRKPAVHRERIVAAKEIRGHPRHQLRERGQRRCGRSPRA